MDPLPGMPVTLVIKAANQKLVDHTVECFLEWSVQKLKHHLAKVYPSKPSENNQRIIYSGKLLKDNLLLKDVLRLEDTTLKQHIVHLVCSPSPEELLQSFKPNSESSPTKTSHSADVVTPLPGDNSQGRTTTGNNATLGAQSRRQSTPMEPSMPPTGGLRHRTLSTPSFSNYYPYNYGSYPMQYGQPAGRQQGYVPANHQQQAMWMQHMYAQQMAHYMQYSTQLAAGGAGLNTNLPPATQPPVIPQPQGQPIAQPGAINPPVAPNVAGPDQNVRMNAGLGPAVDDDDDDNANRDWLDWIYTFCRFSVMLSLVYFYSSLSRFLMVVGLMVFMYMYQKRWFRLRRTPVVRERLENRNTEQGDGEQDNSNQDEQQQQEPQNDNAEQDSNSESQDDQHETDSDTPEPAAPPPPEPPKPGVLTIAWVFLSTFFTSLFPQDPNAAVVEN